MGDDSGLWQLESCTKRTRKFTSLSLPLFRALTLFSAHMRAHTHTLLAVTLSSEQTLRKPSSVREPLLAEQRGKRQRNSPEREERGHFLMGGSGFKPPSWQASALLKCAWTRWWIPTSSSGVVMSELTSTSDLSPLGGSKKTKRQCHNRERAESD